MGIGGTLERKRPVDQEVGWWMTLKWVTLGLHKIFGNC
jgi:hypothetical protein